MNSQFKISKILWIFIPKYKELRQSFNLNDCLKNYWGINICVLSASKNMKYYHLYS